MNYRTPADYFVTICTRHRQLLFDNTTLRDTVELTWRLIPAQRHARNWLLDEWVVMPNHLHGILLRPTPPRPEPTHRRRRTRPRCWPNSRLTCASWVSGARPPTRRTGPGAAAQRINALRRSPGRRVWQRGYYERIVGNDHELERIRVYIRVNPTRWAEDRENLDALLEQMTYRE